MPLREPLRRRTWAFAALAAFVLASVATLAPAANGAMADGVVKYYVVTASYGGKPETLAAIAKRFLGSADRASEIFDLNAGRVQADGAKLADPNKLRAGWVLVLPWDAIGAGVRQGIPPKGQPAPKPTSTSSTTQKPPTPAPPARGGCAGTQAPGAAATAKWGQVRLAPERAWSRTRGDGVTVAIVDSGVDASLPELAGRVTAGADIVAGSGRGNVDCLGTGTAMAAIVAAQAVRDATGVGMAPGARIAPIRVAIDAPSATAADQATAIEVAASTGAKVIAIGSLVDLREPAVAEAVANATRHGAVVVVAALLSPTPAPVAGVLRVGGVGIDGRLAASYAVDGVDVVAPGVDVTSVGIAGTGDVRGTGGQYAVAFAAGTVALVRAMYPDRSAEWVVERLKQTAAPMGASRPNGTYGWGLIDPDRATAPVPQEPAAAAAGGAPRPISMAAALTTAAIIAVIVALLAFRIRRAVRAGARTEQAPADPSADVSVLPDPPGRGSPPGSAVNLATTGPAAAPAPVEHARRESEAGSARSSGAPPRSAMTTVELGTINGASNNSGRSS